VRCWRLQQAFSSRLGKFDRERFVVLGDAVGCVEQLAHPDDEGELEWFSVGDKALIKRLEPSVAPDGAHNGHPECLALLSSEFCCFIKTFSVSCLGSSFCCISGSDLGAIQRTFLG